MRSSHLPSHGKPLEELTVKLKEIDIRESFFAWKHALSTPPRL